MKVNIETFIDHAKKECAYGDEVFIKKTWIAEWLKLGKEARRYFCTPDAWNYAGSL